METNRCDWISENIIKIASAYGFAETLSKALDAIRKRDITIFAVIDHKKNAGEGGVEMPDATLIIFGNAQVGTKLMQDKLGIAIDLPLRLLVGAENGKTVLHYYNPLYLAKEHQLSKNPDMINKISGLLNAITMEAAGQQ